MGGRVNPSSILATIACRQMKRSESDRFMADRPKHEQDVSAEVYVIVPDDGRRAGAIGWRYLALAIAILVAGAALVVTSLSSGGGRSSPAPATAVPPTAESTRVRSGAPTSPSSCIAAPGYGGLGGRLTAFDANNNNSAGPGQPSSGTAFYVVTAIARGCVTAFAVQDSSNPPLTAHDLLVLVGHPYLPGDARQLVNTDRCAIWKSAALKRATGRAYAQATAIRQAGSTMGTGQIEATANPTC
jgi:hypothetical protein